MSIQTALQEENEALYRSTQNAALASCTCKRPLTNHHVPYPETLLEAFLLSPHLIAPAAAEAQFALRLERERQMNAQSLSLLRQQTDSLKQSYEVALEAERTSWHGRESELQATIQKLQIELKHVDDDLVRRKASEQVSVPSSRNPSPPPIQREPDGDTRLAAAQEEIKTLQHREQQLLLSFEQEREVGTQICGLLAEGVELLGFPSFSHRDLQVFCFSAEVV